MSAPALERLEASADALVGALDGPDPEAVLAAAADFRAAVATLRGLAAADPDPAWQIPLRRAAGLAGAAQMRVNFLTDANRRRLAAVAALRGDAPALYGRQGR